MFKEAEKEQINRSVKSHLRLVSPQLCGVTVSTRVCRCDTRPAGPTVVFMVHMDMGSWAA